MHRVTPEIESLSKEILTYTMDRLKMDPPTLDHPLSQTALEEADRKSVCRERV